MHTDAGQFLAIHSERRGHLDVCVVEISEFLLPIFIFKIEEQCPQCVLRIERAFAGCRIVRSDLRTGFDWFCFASASGSAGTGATWAASTAGSALGNGILF